MGYMKAEEYEQSINSLKRATDQILTVLNLSLDTKSVDSVSAAEMKNKFGDKLAMTKIILVYTQLCLNVRSDIQKMYKDSFELRGKVADLASGYLKDVSGKVAESQSALQEEIASVKTSVENVKEKIVAPSFAEVIGDTTALVAPVKEAIKELNQEREKSSSIILSGIDVYEGFSADQKKKRTRDIAFSAIEYVAEKRGIKSLEQENLKFDLLGTFKDSKAPLVRVDLGSEKLAQTLVRHAPFLNGLDLYDNRNGVYIRKDLTVEERGRRRTLLETLREKIREFPNQHWVIRDGMVTSVGKRRAKRKESSRSEPFEEESE